MIHFRGGDVHSWTATGFMSGLQDSCESAEAANFPVPENILGKQSAEGIGFNFPCGCLFNPGLLNDD
jgi:hypothetical protein